MQPDTLQLYAAIYERHLQKIPAHAIAHELNIPASRVRCVVCDINRVREQTTPQFIERNTKIIEMRKNGETNADIAKSCNISQNYVIGILRCLEFLDWWRDTHGN